MADIVVTTSLDVVDANDGVISLREAIEMANANVDADTITFDASLDGEEINLQSELVITQGTVSINGDVDGDGNVDVVISGDSNDNGMADAGDTNIMTIGSGAIVSLDSVHLTEGYARGADGGYDPGESGSYSGDNASAGITNNGTLTITDSIISDNTAIGGDGYDMADPFTPIANGGSASAGILNNAGAVVTINDTLFDGNVAIGGNGIDGYAGPFGAAYLKADGYNGRIGGDGGSAASGVANFGLANINNTLFNDGEATGGNAGNGGNGGDGNGFYSSEGLGGDGGNGGDGGDATLGILNGDTGTLTGNNTGVYLGTAIPGSGGTGGLGGMGGTYYDSYAMEFYSGQNGVDGSPGSNGQGPLTTGTYTFVNQGGDVTAFYDSGFAPFYATGNNSIATAGDDMLNVTSSDEIIVALAGNDTINVAEGISNVFAGAGNDTINLGSGDSTNIVGETFNGGIGDDTLGIVGGVHDFRDDTLFSIENISFGDPGIGVPTSVLLNANQIGTGLSSNANIRFDSYSDTVETINIDINGESSLDLSGFTFSGSIFSARFNIIAGSNAENITGSSIRDIVDYSNSAEGVAVFTSGRGGRGGDAQGDRLTDIEDITGSDHQDQIVLNAATAVDNTVNAGDGDDRIRERDGGTNVLNGEDGDDNIFGGDGSDRIDGGNDQDNLFGGQGNDTLNGGGDDARDVLFGGSQNDVLNGGGGNDALRGNTGMDELNGGDGTDNLQGGNQDDILNGDAGVDTLDGGAGDDILNGGTGNDRLTGGGSNDIFIFEDGSGIDRITDFNFGSGDQIDLTDFNLADFDAVMALATEVNGDVRIQLDGDDRLILEGTTLASLDADDFIL